ncbi:MAG: hypothetical protein P8099_08900 [Gemmatimonadota bacterium]
MRTRVPVLALALGACSSVAAPDVVLDQPYEIALGYEETQQVGNVVQVTFTGVQSDSRCPGDAVCVWEGNAAITVAVSAGIAAGDTLQLNTALDPQSQDWRGVRVTLLEVLPTPLSGQPIPLESYVVRLRIEPVPKWTLTD